MNTILCKILTLVPLGFFLIVFGFCHSMAQTNGMVKIHAGEFLMGSEESEDEFPHHVFVSEFWIDIYEVTQKQFQQVMGDNPSDFYGETLPVDQVTWFEARDYCQTINKRLPTEAEWEKAARAGTSTRYYWGDKILNDFAWYWDNSEKVTHPVGQKKPNVFGLYDMLGNVWEWTGDFYIDNYYQDSPKKDPKGPFASKYRSIRGGSWRDLASFLRTSRRNYELPSARLNHIGFRCVKSSLK